MYKFPIIDNFIFTPEWHSDRMIFLAGPRQIGKTTYAQKKIEELTGAYFNWDNKKVRTAYAKDPDFFVEQSPPHGLIVFDEIHKRPKWKNILKGIFDSYRKEYLFLITGSARLDTFRRSGDSLVGRYFLTHLFPLSTGDLTGRDFSEFATALELIKAAKDCLPELSQDERDNLIQCSGFPEPFFKGQEQFLRRWREQYHELLIREDLRDISRISRLDAIEHLITILPDRITAPLSYLSLSNDLEASHRSVKEWISALEKIFLLFLIKPWHKKLHRSLKKEPKIYFFDWTINRESGPRFENFIAVQLLKAISLWGDRFGRKFALHYIRTYDGQEVDFLISENNKPWLLVEVKVAAPDSLSAIKRFQSELKVPAIVLLDKPKREFQDGQISIMSAWRFLSLLP